MISTEIDKQYQRITFLRNTIALFVFLIPLIYGSVHHFVLITEYIIAFVLLSSYVYLRGELNFSKPSRIFLIFLCITLFITLIQTIPIPLPLINILSPKEFELITQINSIYNKIFEPIRFYTISIEPYISLEYILRLVILILVFITAFQDEFAETQILIKSIAYCGAVIVLYGFIEGLLNFKTFYSQNISLTNEGIIPSVFINPNHQAGFLGLSLFSGISLFYSSESKNEKTIFLFCSILSGAGIFLSLSRGGITAFIASLLFLSSLLLREKFSPKHSLVIFFSAVIIIVIAFYLAYQEITAQLATLIDVKRMENEKYRLVLNSVNLFKDFLVLGVGKGGFETIFNIYREDTFFVSFSLMENQIFQQLADYGILHFGIMLVTIGYFSFIFLRHPLTIRTALLITALFYIILQNLVDFNLEIFSVQVTVIIIISTLISRLSHFKSNTGNPIFGEETLTLNKKFLLFLIIPLTISLIIGIILINSNRREKIEAETELMLNAGLPPEDKYFTNQIRKFPFNYYIPATIAAKYFLDIDKPIIKSYLLHSTLVNPIAFEPHYMLYRYFMKRGEFAKAQSECRLALKYSRGNKERLIFSELLRDVDKKELFKYIPYIPEKITSFADYLVANSEIELAKEFIEDALYLSGENPDIIRSAFYIYIKLKDIANAEKTLKRYERIESGYSIYFLRGIFFEIQDKNEEAIEQFLLANNLNPLNSEIILRIANLYKKIGKFDEAKKYYFNVFLCSNINTDIKVSVYQNLADMYLKEKNTYEALKYLRIALNLRNNDIGIRLTIASICERNGNLNCALNEYRDILRLNPQIVFVEEKVKMIEKRLKEIEDANRFEQLK